MKWRPPHLKWHALVVTVAVCSSAVNAQRGRDVFLLDLDARLQNRKTIDPTLKPAIERADRKAREALKTEVLSIVTKLAVPPSGDKHDYMSQAPYFWPGPNTANGFPYIRRDGERNPEIDRLPDHKLLDKMIDTVERLSLGYYVTHRDQYAERAAEVLRMWFLDPRTRMNPHLDFAQAIPGVNTGRGIGIIETRGLTRVVDAIGLLAGSRRLSRADHAGLKIWFSKYIKWLRESKNGRDESEAKNNHGTFYDVQIVSFALFVGDRALAQKVLTAAKQKRIAKQIEPDGRQPLELERTKSWDYSAMNLSGLVSLALLGESVGVDLWAFQTADGRGIRQAIIYLAPYAQNLNKWPFEQITPIRPEGFYSTARHAGRRYQDKTFQTLIASLPKLPADDPAWLTGSQ